MSREILETIRFFACFILACLGIVAAFVLLLVGSYSIAWAFGLPVDAVDSLANQVVDWFFSLLM